MTIINHRCAVLGKPIAHSLSPVLHNAAYRAMGLDDWHYGKYEVGEGDLEGFLRSLDPQWAGLSLTMPLKKTIQPYGEPSNMWAKELNVANTVVFDWAAPHPSGISGIPAIRLYNTDVLGIQLAFEHAYGVRGVVIPGDRSREAVIIGNGNTATSALAACTMMPGYRPCDGHGPPSGQESRSRTVGAQIPAGRAPHRYRRHGRCRWRAEQGGCRHQHHSPVMRPDGASPRNCPMPSRP